MSDWLIALEGTDAGSRLALFLALFAAVLHALFGALQKGRHDPWITRGVIDVSYAMMAAPFALFVVPWPEPHMWPIFAVVILIHVGYKMAQAHTYTMGAYTVVYPVVRGTGPVFTVIGAYLLFGELFTLIQWLGVFALVAGIFRDFLENLDLIERVLSGGRVQNQQGVMGRGFVFFADDTDDFRQFLHQVGAVLQAPGSVDHQQVSALGLRLPHGVKGQAGWVGTFGRG